MSRHGASGQQHYHPAVRAHWQPAEAGVRQWRWL